MLDRSVSIFETERFRRTHGERLRALIGQPIHGAWVAWDVDDESFFADEAVVLQIGDEQVEIVCWRLDDIALTWNAIDLGSRPAWVSEWGPECRLEWRPEPLDALRRAKGATLREIRVIETRPALDGSAWCLNGLELVHDAGILAIFNGLDENAVADHLDSSDFVRRTPI